MEVIIINHILYGLDYFEVGVVQVYNSRAAWDIETLHRALLLSHFCKVDYEMVKYSYFRDSHFFK